ncbi:MAG: helix-turn-helix domain-containing protein, partial [Kiloniellales bacterium]|nr:helix-turn-helix domain-containing protein [Kiloniellales bacterium]
ERDGYRPCLRCRPETAPFCPAWNGTRTTVGRALKLIAEGALDDAGVEELAAKLGIGARHLSRLFQRHIGASPTQTAKTVRLHRAKCLLEDSDLRITEIAYQAGFKSLRRFNAAFAGLYNEPPSEFRRKRLQPSAQDRTASGATA